MAITFLLAGLGLVGAASLTAASATSPILTTPAWVLDTPPNPSPVRNLLRAVWAGSTTNQWAVGFAADDNQVQRTLILRGDGTGWTRVPSPNVGQYDNYLYGVGGVDANDLWAVGYRLDANRGYQPLTLHWQGSAWAVVPVASPSVVQQYLYAVAAAAPNDVWAVGQAGTGALLLHWDGMAWTSVPPPTIGPNSRLYAISVRASDDVWAVGEWFGTDNTPYQVGLHWDGHSWTNLYPGGWGGLRGVVALAANDVWVVGYDNRRINPVSYHWDGNSWTLIPCPFPGNYSILRAVAATHGPGSPVVWAAGVYNVNDTGLRPYLLRWDGTTWVPVPGALAGSDDHGIFGLAVADGTAAWAVGEYHDRSRPFSAQTLVEHWCNGCTPPSATPTPSATPPSPSPTPPACAPVWSQVAAPNAGRWAGLEAIGGLDANDLWAVGDYNDGFYTRSFTIHWNGNSWGQVAAPGAFLFGVAALAPDDVWAVGSGVRHWDGSAWTTTPATNGLYDVAGVATNDVWAVGTTIQHWDGTRWTRVPNPALGVQESLGIVTANDIWAGGYYCLPPGDEPCRTLIKHWDGTSWQIVPSPSLAGGDNHLDGGLAVLAADDIWAAGRVGYLPLLEHWNGTTWTVQPAPLDGALLDITTLGKHDLWVVGYGGQSAHWDGTAWTRALSMGNVALNGVFALNPSDVWAVGTLPRTPYSNGAAATYHYSGACGTPTPLPSATPTRTATPTP